MTSQASQFETSQVFNDGASSPQPKTTTTDASQPEITVETAIEHAKRAFALRKYEQAAEHYATALEMVCVSLPRVVYYDPTSNAFSTFLFLPIISSICRRTSEHGDSAPEAADLYLSYGKALLENAIAQTSVLGNKEQPETEADEEPAGTFAPFLSVACIGP
jgi:HAT1-interacting factor 1